MQTIRQMLEYLGSLIYLERYDEALDFICGDLSHCDNYTTGSLVMDLVLSASERCDYKALEVLSAIFTTRGYYGLDQQGFLVSLIRAKHFNTVIELLKRNIVAPRYFTTAPVWYLLANSVPGKDVREADATTLLRLMIAARVDNELRRVG